MDRGEGVIRKLLDGVVVAVAVGDALPLAVGVPDSDALQVRDAVGVAVGLWVATWLAVAVPETVGERGQTSGSMDIFDLSPVVHLLVNRCYQPAAGVLVDYRENFSPGKFCPSGFGKKSK